MTYQHIGCPKKFWGLCWETRVWAKLVHTMGPIVSQDHPQNSVSCNSVCEPLHSVTVSSVLKSPKIYGRVFSSSKNWNFLQRWFFLSVQTWNLSIVLHQFQEKRVNCGGFWQQLAKGRCSTHLFWTICKFLCKYLLKYKFILWKL